MKFCPRCGRVLYPKPKKDILICKYCGYIETLSEEIALDYKFTIQEVSSVPEIAIIENFLEVLPKTKVICPRCGNNEAYWKIIQTKPGDEPETIFFKCTKCGYVWREE